ncbi:kinesin-like protein KIN-8A isoform X1 [Manihot esculenta]|uniref:kinesin-like protein KIN-8A isoform X1 n=1 Tax=Manihot esculenta TaxID=3983 RepID=UPI000B5D7B39|nr:kinesin-like protein KIN-8A isoform X1 [Manihot esculenta]
MPVSTRSQINNQDQNGSNTEQRTRNTSDQEGTHASVPLRNPHQGLKEKLKALTLLYEQQKKASSTLRNLSPKPEDKRFSTNPSVDLLSSCRKKEKDFEETKDSEQDNVIKDSKIPTVPTLPYAMLNSTVTRNLQAPANDAKENPVMDPDRVIGFSLCARKANVSTTVARKLSMESSVPQTEPRGFLGNENVLEVGKLEAVYQKNEASESRILVFVRLRPMFRKEREAGLRCCVKIVNRKDVYLTEFANENDYLRLKRIRGRHFAFDASFSDSTSQQEVYSTTTADLVEAVLQGRNGSVFCYGATGAGKTYTMLGTTENPGVMVLAIKDLFTKVRQRSCDGNHTVRLSYLEVYNETVRDLLSPGRPLVLREDKQGIIAAGLTQYRAYSTDEVIALLQKGNQNRTTEPTRANETSSRSHAILQVVVEYRVKDASMNVVNRVGKLSLIDLAGSERALATDQRTLRSLEGANINRSLLALSSCINALVEGKKHIPYRNSKLTQLLKDSLGGVCNTVMIANISPGNLSFGETQNTLHWADRAKEIRTKACEANFQIQHLPESETDKAKLLLELQKENRELRIQLARQQQKLLTLQVQSLAANASSTPSSISSLLTPNSQTNDKRKTRPSTLAGNCFTPESRKRREDDTVRELQRTVKTLEAEIERMKKEHGSQIKKKDERIYELSRKSVKTLGRDSKEGTKRVVTRASLRPKESNIGELKSPSHRFKSPAPTTKKRSFWDITTVNSPSMATLTNGRKTRGCVIAEPAVAPSMLLQVFALLLCFPLHNRNSIIFYN